jgi:hypothetical protein
MTIAQKQTIRPYALALAVLSAVGRVLPHPFNVTPVGGSSLFAGARLNGWMAFLLPILVMAITDPIVGGFSFATPFVYGAFLINVLIGRTLRRTNSPIRIGAAAFFCSLQFFLITNFAIFLQYFPHTLSGLAECFTLAIPYFGRTLAGDLATTAIVFGLHYWLTRSVAHEERALAVA